jgi:hypothetical protein
MLAADTENLARLPQQALKYVYSHRLPSLFCASHQE